MTYHPAARFSKQFDEIKSQAKCAEMPRSEKRKQERTGKITTSQALKWIHQIRMHAGERRKFVLPFLSISLARDSQLATLFKAVLSFF